MDKIIIFDTTLRDGEQAPGASLDIDEKIEIAKQLEKLGVDVIEAGFPVTSPADFEAVRRIAHEVTDSVVCGLTHANADAIDRTWGAIKDAKKSRIHVFLSSSDIHIEHQLHKTRDQVLDLSVAMVTRAKSYCDDVEFSPMDSTRTEPEFLYRILEAVINAGATTVNIPDTVGYAMPREFGALIDSIFKNVPNIDKAVVSVHCHNDLGFAVANSLVAVNRGARQIECTINGIGERAGNAALEEIVMAVNTRKDVYNLETGIDTTQIYRTSRMVSDFTGFLVQPNKAIVGGNAFRHESGIHQDGVIKERATYEIMSPADIGLTVNSLVLGKHSGRHAFKNRLLELGYKLDDDDLNRAFAAFKDVADKKKEIDDRDIEALVADELRAVSEIYHLEHVQVCCGEPAVPTASVKLSGPDGELLEGASVGTGPVDAIYKAISQLVPVPNELTEFSVKSVTEGIDAIGEVTIKIESDDRTYIGRGASTDIIVASAKAYLNALNRLISVKNRS
ncbi:MAG: 2-isopropylmalate synthase [Chloroflexi bacterium]|jgi:2-isopropylmalate synthase|nr:2-isopropylmalate synthase [Chloroflexota bacterium]MBT7082406.1 2-isopropylmalate synthase [Chloroflexota bacterium]MBT7290646.1 2-isopropylmalate synthase [Chloroflexota bacterium]